MKNCCRCKQNKNNEDFNKNKSNKDGLADYCKPCITLYNSERRKEILRDKKKYRDNNKEKRRISQKEYRAKDRNQAKYYNAKYTYGLESNEFDALMASGCCGICETQNSGSKSFHIDHCHETGKVRGILCSNCNLALGGFKDNTIILEKAIKYLDRNKKV